MRNGEEAWAVFQSLFLTGRNLWLVGGAWALLFMLGLGLPQRFKKVYRENVVPYLALAVCSAAVWIPGLRPGLPPGQDEVAGIDGHEIGFRVALGFLLAATTYFIPILMFVLTKKVLPESTAKAVEKIVRKVW